MSSFSLRFALVSLCIFLCCASGCSGCDFDLDFWGDDDPDECSSDADCGEGECVYLYDGNRCDARLDCSNDDDCDCGEVCSSGACEADPLGSACCGEESALCSFDSDCCSGHCDDFGSCEAESLPACVRAGESCSAEEACCEGVCADGVCAAQKCEPNGEPQVVAQIQPGLVALSEDVSRLYWVSEGALHAIPKVGGEPALLARGAGAGSCISRFGNRTSWCGDSGDIWRLIDGDEAPVLYAVAPAEVSVLVDSEAGVFWSDTSGAIMAAPEALPAPAELLATATATTSAPIVVDASRLFFADGPTVNAVPLAGGAVSAMFTGAGPIEALAQDEGDLYFVDALSMTALGKIDGLPESIGFAESARTIAVSTTHVFYADSFIARIPKAGGNTVTLVNEVVPPRLLVDDQCVYWVDAEQGRIMKVSKN